jgi:DUF971 family protein
MTPTFSTSYRAVELDRFTCYLDCMLSKTPTQISRLGFEGIQITWSDGHENKISSEVLRKNCPCAGCKEARGDQTHAKPLTGKKSLLKIVESSRDEELRLEKIWQVGGYALGMEWGDGHQTGIYTYLYLEELGKLGAV